MKIKFDQNPFVYRDGEFAVAKGIGLLMTSYSLYRQRMPPNGLLWDKVSPETTLFPSLETACEWLNNYKTKETLP